MHVNRGEVERVRLINYYFRIVQLTVILLKQRRKKSLLNRVEPMKTNFQEICRKTFILVLYSDKIILKAFYFILK